MCQHGESPPERYWVRKFGNAFRGTWQEVRQDRSFRVHFGFAAAVIVCAALLQITGNFSLVEWCLLLLCITVVLAAEVFNSALESMAKAITDEQDPRVGSALDLGSAAVLIASIGAAVVGTIIFLFRLGVLLGWWS